MRKCISCGKSFKRPVYVSRKKWRKDWKFCSLKCRSDYGWVTKTCPICGKEFRSWKHQKHIYCSQLCANHSRPDRGGKIKRVCIVCGKEFIPKRRGVFGRQTNFCSTECYGISQRGKNHWNWKGGITPENQKLRNTKEYKEWRLEVYRRDHFACQDCGKHCNRKNIVAHHIKDWKHYPELRYVVSNGITYCRSCHIKEHQRLKNS